VGLMAGVSKSSETVLEDAGGFEGGKRPCMGFERVDGLLKRGGVMGGVIVVTTTSFPGM
jgi:hypothetical protein